MLARPSRLSRSETTLVLKTGRLSETPFLKVRFRACQEAGGSKTKFAVLVPAFVLPLSSGRSRLKRRTRHIIRQLQPEIKSGQAIAIILKKPAAGLNFEKLREKIRESLRQTRIL